MRIYTLWHADEDMPWITDAVDEYTAEDGFPEPYLEKRKQADVRELIIDVPNKALRALFSTPSISGTVINDSKRIP